MKRLPQDRRHRGVRHDRPVVPDLPRRLMTADAFRRHRHPRKLPPCSLGTHRLELLGFLPMHVAREQLRGTPARVGESRSGPVIALSRSTRSEI